MRQLPIKEVFIPKIDLDHKLIHTVYQKVCGLKENVKQCLTQPSGVSQPSDKKTEGNFIFLVRFK